MFQTTKWSRLAVMIASAGVVAACNTDKILDVKDPDVADPGTLEGAQALNSLRAGALADFQVAFSGAGDLANNGHEGQANLSALLADEFLSADTYDTRNAIDRREIQPGNGTTMEAFLDLSRARAAADLASSRYDEFAADDPGHAETLNLGGYTRIFFAENWCSGVPISTLQPGGQIVYGEPETTAELLQNAIDQFDAAIAIASEAGDATQVYLASVGKARALLNLNQPAQAAAVAATVPTSFVYEIEHSNNSARQYNGIYNYTWDTGSFTAVDEEAGEGLPYLSADDPRVPWFNTQSAGFDGETLLILQLKYSSKDANVVLADGIEARLIQAEASLRAGNIGSFITFLNNLRASTGFGDLSDPGTASGRVDMLFRERAFYMWLTSHRLGDMRRLVRQYGRSVSSVFPTGFYHKGGIYGDDVNFPISAEENNNPNFSGCIDRNP
jgi:starch-binding outer membrane protein, SusD/RagB family